ncbi:MAG: AMP-binding protein, partial [Polynucleobacter sp.]|nr:AMP-binding protein [Polynucleobacter sp.]
MSHPYAAGLDKNPANYVALTPLTFIERSAYIYPERVATIHGRSRFTWRQAYERSRRLASALVMQKVGAGDTVAVMLNNTPEMFECHFGVPMCGAVLNTMNTRLDAESIAFMLNHGEAKVLITDREYSPMVKTALAALGREILVIDVDDPEYTGPGERVGSIDYEALLASGQAD